MILHILQFFGWITLWSIAGLAGAYLIALGEDLETIPIVATIIFILGGPFSFVFGLILFVILVDIDGSFRTHKRK